MSLQFTAKIFVNTLALPSGGEEIDRFLHPTTDGQREPGSRWCLDTSMSSADLYIYLKARFGPPNGAFMAVRAPHSNNFIQWHFTLKSGKYFVDFVGLNTRTEIWVQGYQDLSSDDWSSIVRAVKDDFSQFGPQMKKVRGELEKWKLFSNPYKRLERLVSKYRKELEVIDVGSLQWPKEPDGLPGLVTAGQYKPTADIEDYLREFTDLSETVWRAVELSTSLRLIVPIWGESFLNFLIFLTAKPQIKDDPRLFEDFLRKEIDIRLKLLPVNCLGIGNGFDIKAEAVGRFLSVMAERNDMLHGNVRPERMAFETVYFDGTIPLFMETHGLTKVSLLNSLKGIEPVDTLQNFKAVESFIAYLSTCLDEDVKQQLEFCLRQRDLGWRQETGRMGVLFPDYVVDAFLR
ncbi:MAG: hypothetical protein A4E65_03815 [Syntrophorhabdus sp. PtaU1.Bin153]|nr:MAG: hypothetical protein A4E65_03815 [Syntrophorhabdus sp. PtaU1.Bin153]